MKQDPRPLRRAAATLLVAAVLPFTPSLAQDTAAAPPVVNLPPPTVSAPPPVATPSPAPTMGAPAAVRGPVVEHVATPGVAPAAAPTRTARAAPARASTPARSTAPVRSAAARAPATPVPAAAPSAGTVSAGAAPSLAVPQAAPAPAPAAQPVAQPVVESTPIAWWPFVAGLAVLIIGAAVLIARRRRRAEEEAYYYEEPAYVEPVAEEPVVAAPAYQEPIVAPVYATPAAEPVAAATEQSAEVELGQPDPADMEALAATAAPHPDRPWLEFLMRPVRAGASGDEARVEFELTVGNTGAVPARDVRVSTWMLEGKGTDMEQSLIEPPAGASHSEMSIAPGEGAKVEAAIALPRDDNSPVLPVVVADARYRLPDGSEGRTSASFAIGMPGADGVRPFRTGSGFTEDVEAELHGEPERV